MRRVVFVLCGLLIVAQSPSVAAQEVEPVTTEAEKLYKEFAEYMIGGVWKAKIKLGERISQGEDGPRKWVPSGEVEEAEDEYNWIADRRFVQLVSRRNGKPVDNIILIGVDSTSGKLTWWNFNKRGMLPAAVTKDRDGKFNINTTLTNQAGRVLSWKIIVLPNGKDQTTVTTAFAIDGVEAPKDSQGPPTIWKRHPK
jgi:hypothetical protein